MAIRLLKVADQGGRPARLVAPAAAVRGLVRPSDLERVRRQVTRAADQLQAARTAVYRELWSSAATRLGASVTETTSGFLEISRGPVTTLVRETLVELDSPVVLEQSGDRVATSERLASVGLPVTESLPFTPADPAPALEFLRAHESCAVKPAYGTGAGAGVTCEVRTVEEFTRAALNAYRYCPELVIERQLEGGEHRLLVLDGEVIGAVRRRSPELTGDGRSTVTDLILAENRRRLAAGGRDGLWLLNLSVDACLMLRKQGLSAASVPADGQRIAVARATNTGSSAACEAEDPHPAIVADAVRASQALRLRWASVELTTAREDRGTAWPGAGVIEVNSTPGLSYHYQVSDPARAQPVADAVLAVLLRERPTVDLPHPRVSEAV